MCYYIQRVETTQERALAKTFINEHHSYIQYADRPSRKLYWNLFEDSKLVGVFGLSSAFSNPMTIRNFMQEHNISFNELANNIVFCLFGNLDRNAGTKFLKLIRNDAKLWWKERYGDELKAIQSFVLPPRTGAVYKADNWLYLGETKGKHIQRMRTLYGKEREEHKEDQTMEIRVFKNGEVKYLLRDFITVPKKLIFVRLLK